MLDTRPTSLSLAPFTDANPDTLRRNHSPDLA
jgi:hypothetical protein